MIKFQNKLASLWKPFWNRTSLYLHFLPFPAWWNNVVVCLSICLFVCLSVCMYVCICDRMTTRVYIASPSVCACCFHPSTLRIGKENGIFLLELLSKLLSLLSPQENTFFYIFYIYYTKFGCLMSVYPSKYPICTDFEIDTICVATDVVSIIVLQNCLCQNNHSDKSGTGTYHSPIHSCFISPCWLTDKIIITPLRVLNNITNRWWKPITK